MSLTFIRILGLIAAIALQATYQTDARVTLQRIAISTGRNQVMSINHTLLILAAFVAVEPSVLFYSFDFLEMVASLIAFGVVEGSFHSLLFPVVAAVLLFHDLQQ